MLDRVRQHADDFDILHFHIDQFHFPLFRPIASRTVTTDSTGKASVVLTLPSTAGTVRVTAEGQYALGHPVATFTETAQ